MRQRYLLDTNICIVLIKQQPPEVAERFSRCRVGEVLISAITAAELEVGVVASGPAAARNREALIAAHALALDVVLVTNNPSDFQAYPDLTIENWVDPGRGG